MPPFLFAKDSATSDLFPRYSRLDISFHVSPLQIRIPPFIISPFSQLTPPPAHTHKNLIKLSHSEEQSWISLLPTVAAA